MNNKNSNNDNNNNNNNKVRWLPSSFSTLHRKNKLFQWNVVERLMFLKGREGKGSEGKGHVCVKGKRYKTGLLLFLFLMRFDPFDTMCICF